MVTPGDLLQLGNAILESTVPNCRLQNRKAKINLRSSDNFNAPFDVMVPGKPVEVMKGLWMKEMGWTRQQPVHPKQFNNAVQAEDLDDLHVELGYVLERNAEVPTWVGRSSAGKCCWDGGGSR